MDRLGDHLFAGAGLAGDEDRARRAGYGLEHREQRLHGPAAPDDALELIALLELRARIVAGAANNQLAKPRDGQRLLYYHSGDQKQVVGYAKVVRAAYPDPTASEGDWSSVDLAPVKALKNPVTLAAIKADNSLKTMVLVRNSRLSVMPLTRGQFERVLQLGAQGITSR